MPKKLDLTGQRFGRLLVLTEAPSLKRTAWYCLCDCGNKCIALTTLLRQGKKLSCGCLFKEFVKKHNEQQRVNLSGKKFGRLLVVKRIGSSNSGQVWECICDCGNTVQVTTGRLKQGNTKSCGCFKRESQKEKYISSFDLTGKTFGHLTVIGRVGTINQQNIWRCKCKCGNLTEASTGSLNSGHRTSCGCLNIAKPIDLTGKRFFRLVVLERLQKDKFGSFMYLCRCDCGNESIVNTTQLTSGKTKSCGCYKREQTSKTFRKHGKSGTKEYSAMISSKRRAIQHKANGSYTVQEIENLYSKQEGLCVYCKTPLKVSGFHRDHKTPLIRGGNNSIDNIQLLCPNCNRKKHISTHEEYLKKATNI